MTLAQLRTQVRAGQVDTVIVAFPDLFDRLVGKRFRADHFLKSVVRGGTHACSYLLAVNLDMDPLDGFKVANWETGFGDFRLAPDVDTFRLLPWQPGTALVLCDYVRHDNVPVAEVPRSVLRRQVELLGQRGWTCACASELEFYLFNQTYESLAATGYHDLRPSSDYRIDYHIAQPTRDEPLMRAIRNGLTAARVPIESSKGEWSCGQHEINFTHDHPLAMADLHTVFKHGVKEIAAQHGKAVSFMAKYAAAEAGSSCHLHLSLWSGRRNLFWDSRRHAGSKLFRQFLGGLMRYSPELCLFFAPTVNSYKRFQPGSWAPTRMAWANDNRTTGFRIVGHDTAFRIENRMPGADANPYLAFAAMLAAGMAGVREDLEPGAEYAGNAYLDARLERLPATLREATDRFEASRLAQSAFGPEVVEFMVRHARLEQQAFDNAVTDWEKRRYLEQI
jgi:glutamine synthetase